MEGAKILPGIIGFAEFSEISEGAFIVVGLFAQPARILLAQNLTDQLLYFSQDGFNVNFALPAGGFLLLDVGTNKGTPNTAAMPSGLGLYVKAPTATLPTLGSVYLSYWYAD